jgi:hypothetical protein
VYSLFVPVLFTCKLCGQTHEGVLDAPPEFTPEEVETRRQTWLAAEDKLDKSPTNEHFEKAHTKAWFAYMATKANGVERLPPTITTKKEKGEFILLCTAHIEPT